MPWEHAIIGYITYSLSVHVAYREPPSSLGAGIVVIGSLTPDIVDKPLAWGFDLWGSGYAIGHSLFAAAPVSMLVIVLAWMSDRTRVGIAFAIGYLTHLLGDVMPSYLLEGEVPLDRLLWPLRGRGSGYEDGFRAEFQANLAEYLNWLQGEIASGDPEPYLLLLIATVMFGMLLWMYDGMPVARNIYAALLHVGNRALRAVRSN